MKHGTISGYQHHKCRCTDCCNAKREYERTRIQKPKFVYPKPLEHGTSNAYTYHGCRCEICKAFMRGYQMGYIKLNCSRQYISEISKMETGLSLVKWDEIQQAMLEVESDEKGAAA